MTTIYIKTIYLYGSQERLAKQLCLEIEDVLLTVKETVFCISAISAIKGIIHSSHFDI